MLLRHGSRIFHLLFVFCRRAVDVDFSKLSALFGSVIVSVPECVRRYTNKSRLYPLSGYTSPSKITGAAFYKLLILIVLLSGLLASWLIFTSAGKPSSVAPSVVPLLVETQPLKTADRPPHWRTGGRVVAAKRLDVAAEVTGQITRISEQAIPGASMSKGDFLAAVDDRDLRLLLRQRQADEADARARLDIEQGQVQVARDEYELAGRPLGQADLDLVLRKPQLEQAKAAYDRAVAERQRAELQLQRSRVTMPFDGLILQRTVAEGAWVTAGQPLFDVVATDEFWIEVTVPRSFLPWLDANAGHKVSHDSWSGKHRSARLVNRLGLVDDSDQQVRLLLAIDDPLALQDSLSDAAAVYLNDFVELTLVGQMQRAESLLLVPMNQLQQRDDIWVVASPASETAQRATGIADKNTTAADDGVRVMQRRHLDVIYRGRQWAWVAGGFEAGDQLLVHRLDSMTEGMLVRVAGKGTGEGVTQAEQSVSDPTLTPDAQSGTRP